jgi:hypothetical protein
VSAIDTGDTIREKSTGITHLVSCCHDYTGYGVVYVSGHPLRTLRLIDVELVSKASDRERLASLKAMADLKHSYQHRSVCARGRLAALEGRADVGSGDA